MKGFTAKEFLLKVFDTNEEIFRTMTEFTDEEKDIYNKKLERLKYLHKSNRKVSTKEKGNALEELVVYLFNKSAVFEVLENIHTSTNEIDQIITLNSKGRFFREQGILDLKFDTFLAECKNYNKKIGVTWVGKFWSLLNSSCTTLGIMFSYHGLTGSGWRDSVGLTKKIYTAKENPREKIHIIDINITDFEKISEGTSLLNLIFAKINALKLETDFNKFLSKHPCETKNKKLT
ncbi:acetylglutamate semialdehyde dehydrogenase [Bacillus sp. BS3(2021)]|uniref:acetylglutamate semialdehyde dehydrogenase n=1 Tax=Bacillus TaxID=1386 RepID=UPI001E431DCC|nr:MULTISPECIES: acetylglutamate semialdehyde dehydrogenase [Bacillus]MCD2370828.1 acetylglutamate semialdehyde dehydrogenase [Bacillus sp. BS3(2021)]MCJ8232221.1 acetylglutamate semialdehyde dehydrogenase [Bacillus paralicheniformis]